MRMKRISGFKDRRKKQIRHGNTRKPQKENQMEEMKLTITPAVERRTTGVSFYDFFRAFRVFPWPMRFLI